MENLQEIGLQLDKDIYPRIFNGGIVLPNTTSAPLLTLGKEQKDEEQGTRRPSTRSWPRPARWQRQTNRTWATYNAPSIICPNLKEGYESQLGLINEAYPNARAWAQEDGVWIQARSRLLSDYWHEAVFVTAFSCRWPYLVKSWGFWAGGILKKPLWIGPRHTNFPDGSICAFEPTDCTWTAGDSIIKLLDIYTLWALRHLHLEFFGRWPGQQSIAHPYERLTEQKVNELCGCGRYGKLYGECCRKTDLGRDRVGDALNFLFCTDYNNRQPPESIILLINDKAEPPTISSVF